MKVAVIFTGFFRTFNYIKQSFKDCIMNPLNADIFFSSPKTLFTLPQHEDPVGIAYIPPRDYLAYQKLVEPEIIDFFGDKLKSYELIDYDAETYKKLCKDNNIPYHTRDGLPTFRILSQLNNKALSMKVFKKYIEKHNINYDLVIMTRGDIKYFTPLNISLIDFNSIGYPNHNINPMLPSIPSWCKLSDKIPKAFNDILSLGPQKHMLTWCDVTQTFFDYFNDHVEITTHGNRQEGLYFTAENIMAYHLMKNNMNWYGSNYIECALWRHEK